MPGRTRPRDSVLRHRRDPRGVAPPPSSERVRCAHHLPLRQVKVVSNAADPIVMRMVMRMMRLPSSSPAIALQPRVIGRRRELIMKIVMLVMANIVLSPWHLLGDPWMVEHVGRMRSLEWIANETLQQEVPQAAVERLGHRRWAVIPQNSLVQGEEVLHAQLRPRGMAREHLQHQPANGPHVSPATVLRVGEHLWCHEEGRSLHARAADGAVSIKAHVATAAKVADLRSTEIIDEDVGPLDVPVDDVVLVEVLEPAQHLASIRLGHLLREGSELLQQRRHGATGHPLLEDEDLPPVFVNVRPEVGHDVWVVQAPHEINLVAELPQDLRARRAIQAASQRVLPNRTCTMSVAKARLVSVLLFVVVLVFFTRIPGRGRTW
eukprot:scaffold343_cov245-Pinguiococcus_pyrenoidosus.AAC.7